MLACEAPVPSLRDPPASPCSSKYRGGSPEQIKRVTVDEQR